MARKSVTLSETLDFLNFLGSQYTEYLLAVEDCKTQQREVDKQIQALKASLQRIQTPLAKESYNLIVPIETSAAGEFELEVSYLVNRASWTPLYDLRVNTASNTVNFGYLAEITQNTAEDWKNVSLTLSTAKPGLGTLPPKLEPWYIGLPEMPDYSMRRNRQTTGMDILASAVPMAMAAVTSEESKLDEAIIEAETVVAEVTKEGSIATFKINSSGNIPSDGSPYKNTIFYDDFPCSFEYVAMPRLVSFAYLQAKVKNSHHGATFLPGKANIFRNDIFVGTTQIENIPPGQEFRVNLGIDEGLKIERDLVERLLDKKLIGGDRKITYAYRIIITNLLEQEVKLNLSEQLPVSRHEQIKVRLTRSNPQIQLGEMGILEWDLLIAPQSKQEIYYQFIVEYPPQLTVVGLDV